MTTGDRPKKKRRKQGASDKGTLWIVLGVVGSVLLICCGGGGFFANRLYQQVAGNFEIPAGQSYSQWRDQNPTKLIKHGPAPQEYDVETPPANVEEIIFPSGNLQLKAWVHRPPGIAEPRPALLYVHGGFAFGASDFNTCDPAVNRGMVVMVPMLRGENGNPGEFELLRGEVDDARAAAQWLAAQPYVDASRIYAFGHSVGGGNTAVLSLLDDVPIRHSGSSGGLYPPLTFVGWADIVPFENTPEERAARLLIGNISHMQRPHYAYLGTGDSFQDAAKLAESEGGGSSKLIIEMVSGDHFTSLAPSLQKYLEVIDSEIQ